MKKTIICILLLFIQILFLFGCSGNDIKSYTIYELQDSTDSSLLNYSGNTYEFNNVEPYVDQDAEKEKSIVFLGKEHNLTYDISHQQYMINYEVEQYHDTECPDIIVNFKKGTDELINIYYQGTSPIESLTADVGKLDNEENYRVYAKDLLTPYIDLEKYKYSCDTQITNVTDKGVDNQVMEGFCLPNENQRAVYRLIYKKYINDYLTGEYSEVDIDSSGMILSVTFNMINEFTNDMKININSDLLDKAISEKASSLCNIENYSLESYSISEKILIRGDEQDILLLVGITTVLKNQQQGTSITEPCMIAVKINS